MSPLLQQITELIDRKEVCISEHGYDELAADGIFVRDLIKGISGAKLVEEYPDYIKGPCALVLQVDRDGKPLHAVWGIPKGATGPAVLVTAYRPDPQKWTKGFMRRKK
ncbi:MAG: DUF4258 domain-containing protein [Nitrospirota bacterium]|nr:DUF4258 domain-containing protein [Nitrospirota bacterium]